MFSAMPVSGPGFLPNAFISGSTSTSQTSSKVVSPDSITAEQRDAAVDHYNIDRAMMARGTFLTLPSQYQRFKYIKNIQKLFAEDTQLPPALEGLSSKHIIYVFVSQ